MAGDPGVEGRGPRLGDQRGAFPVLPAVALDAQHVGHRPLRPGGVGHADPLGVPLGFEALALAGQFVAQVAGPGGQVGLPVAVQADDRVGVLLPHQGEGPAPLEGLDHGGEAASQQRSRIREPRRVRSRWASIAATTGPGSSAASSEQRRAWGFTGVTRERGQPSLPVAVVEQRGQADQFFAGAARRGRPEGRPPSRCPARR